MCTTSPAASAFFSPPLMDVPRTSFGARRRLDHGPQREVTSPRVATSGVSMDRRAFVRLLAAAPFAPALKEVAASPAAAPSSSPSPEALPKLRIVSAYAPAAAPGIP